MYLLIGSAYVTMRALFALTTQWHFDQVVVGNLAADLSDGPLVPFWYYAWPRWTHGLLILSPVLYLGFLIFGPINQVLTGLAIALTAATCLLWVYLADRYGSRRLAWLVGIAFVFTPPYWNQMSATLWGIHIESCFFAVIQFWALLRMLDKGVTLFRIVVLGLLSGLGVLFSLHSAFVVVAIAIFWALRKGLRAAFAPVLLYGLVVVIAYLPAVVYNIVTGEMYGYYTSGGVEVLAENSGLVGWLENRFLLKLVVFAKIVLPGSPNFAREPQNLMYMGAVGLGWLVCLFGMLKWMFAGRGESIWVRISVATREQPLMVLAFLFPAVYAFLYTIGPVAIPEPRNPLFYRYLLPLFPFYFLLLAHFAERFKYFAIPLLAVGLIWIGLPQVLPLPRAERYLDDPLKSPALHQVKGYDHWRLHFESVPFYLNARPPALRHASFQTVAAKVEGGEKHLLSASVGRNYRGYFDAANSDLDAFLDQTPKEELQFVFYGLGYDYGCQTVRGDAPPIRQEHLRQLWETSGKSLESDNRAAWAVGVGWGTANCLGEVRGLPFFLDMLAGRHKRPASAERDIELPEKKLLEHGRKIAREISPGFRDDFAFGVGIAVGEYEHGQEETDPAKVLRLLIPNGTAKQVRSAKKGFGYGVGLYLDRFYIEVPDYLLKDLMRGDRPSMRLEYRGLDRFLLEWGLEFKPSNLDPRSRRILPVAG
jgi:hypothetical protein